MNAAAKIALGSVLANDGPSQALVFGPMNGDVVTRAFREACTSLGIEDFRFHDLRHTAASWIRMTGADIHTVALVLGHSDLRMAARYQHLSPAFLGEAVGRLDAVFGELRCPDVANQKQLPASNACNY